MNLHAMLHGRQVFRIETCETSIIIWFEDDNIVSIPRNPNYKPIFTLVDSRLTMFRFVPVSFSGKTVDSDSTN